MLYETVIEIFGTLDFFNSYAQTKLWWPEKVLETFQVT